jgi:hypothetical protein
LSGYGAIVYLITRDGIVEYDLACRNDWCCKIEASCTGWCTAQAMRSRRNSFINTEETYPDFLLNVGVCLDFFKPAHSKQGVM